MEAPEIAELLESAAPAPARTPDIGAIERRAGRRRRRRRFVVGGTSVVALVVALVAVVPASHGRREVVAGSLSSRPLPVTLTKDGAALDLALLDGTRLRLSLPDAVGRALAGATFADLELHGSLYADWATGWGWRIDVTVNSIESLIPTGDPLRVRRSSGASAATVDRQGRRLGMQFGPWAAVVSGDSLTQADIDALLARVTFTESVDSFLAYRGSLPLWTIDDSSTSVTGADMRVAVFMGQCQQLAVEPTATGLLSGRLGRSRPRNQSGRAVRPCRRDRDLARKLASVDRPRDRPS